MDTRHADLYTSEKIFCNDPFPFMTFTARGEEQQTMHSHDYVQMWYVKNGHYRHHLNGVDFKLTRGNLFIVPPYMAHFVDTTGCREAELVACEFSGDFMRIAAQDDAEHLFDIVYLEPILIHCKTLEPSLYFHGSAAEELESLLSELEHEYNERDRFYSTMIRANVLRLLALIARQYGEQRDFTRDEMFARYRNAVNRALQYIDAHFTEKIYLEDVCRIALMSPSAFSAIFKNITGSTFTEYLLYRRVSKARDLLSETTRPVTDISLDCGFNDPTYFHRVFKKITGISPGQYRKS